MKGRNSLHIVHTITFEEKSQKWNFEVYMSALDEFCLFLVSRTVFF